MQVSREWLETRTKESKHMCKFLGSLTRLEPTAMGGRHRRSAGVDVPTTPLFCGADQGVQHVCTRVLHENACICARPTTDRDLACVIPD